MRTDSFIKTSLVIRFTKGQSERSWSVNVGVQVLYDQLPLQRVAFSKHASYLAYIKLVSISGREHCCLVDRSHLHPPVGSLCDEVGRWTKPLRHRSQFSLLPRQPHIQVFRSQLATSKFGFRDPRGPENDLGHQRT